MCKHAWMIMAHNQFDLLKKLLKSLDNEDADIFLHVDKKAAFDMSILSSSLVKSQYFMTERIKVTWGGYSQIAAELLLLEKAVSTGHYEFYHLITGVDFPLKNIKEIQSFFDNHCGYEFISNEECTEKELERIKYYYFFQDLFGEKFIGKILRKTTLKIQKAFHIQRNIDIEVVKIGSAYFDIDDELARYIVAKKSEIKKRFKFTRCADELFLQILFFNSLLVKKGKKQVYKSETSHKYIQTLYLDVLRAIDWTRGFPYIWKIEDNEILKSSGCMFARKFDYNKYPEIVNKLENDIKSS